MGKTVTSRFVLKGDNQLNSAFGKAKQQMAAIGKQATIAGVAIGALFARSVIKNTIEQEQAVAQLNAALKSTGRFTPEASQALRDHAAALQQVSTSGDEAIIKGQNILLTFRNIGGETFARATQAILDVSVAMGVDLKSAAIQVGKALNDPKTQLTALSRSGITFSESQKKAIFAMVDTGNAAGAQAAILKELETQFGGSAKAARDTFGGALATVSNNFGDLLEVTDGKDGATEALNDLADTLAKPEIKEGFQNLAEGALTALEILAQLPSTIGFLKDELKQLFGVVANDDFVRRDEEIAELEAQLVSSRKSANAWFRTEGNIFFARAKSLEIEIALKKASLQADRDAAGLAAANTNKPTKSPETGIRDTLPEAPSGTGDVNEAAQKARNSLEREYAGIVRSLLSPSEAHMAQITRIDELYISGVIPSAEAYAEALDRINDKFEESQVKVEELDQFAIQAARSIQTSFADFLFDPFDQGLDGMLKGFASTIRRMVAEIAAQKLLMTLFGGLAGSSNSFISAIGGLFGGTRDSGGRGYPGQAYAITPKAGTEIFMPDSAGTFIPNVERLAGPTVNVNVDARQNDNPASILALIPVIQAQIEQSLMLKSRRGYL